MHNRDKKRVLITIICFVLLLSGCGKNDKYAGEQITEDKQPVHIPIIFLADPSSQITQNKKMVESFNKLYKDEYVVDIKWLTDNIENYRNNLKKWNILGELPVIITDVAVDNEFYKLLIESDRLVDISQYMDEQWMSKIDDQMIDICREEDGEIYMVPSNYLFQGCAGIIYNESLLKKAGYDKFPNTWEGFWQCLDSLRNNGITSLSLHADTFWVPMLMSGSYGYSSGEGKEFMDKDLPESYDNQSMRQIFTCMDRLFEYSYTDALEIEYGEAANRFINGEAAIFANGFWMVEELLEKNVEDMKFAPFPGNVLMNAPEMSGWAIVNDYDPEVIEGAVKFLEYRTEFEKMKMSEPIRQNQLYYTYAEAVANVKDIMPNYQLKWEKRIQEEYLANRLPDFIKNEISIDDLLIEADEFLKAIEEEK